MTHFWYVMAIANIMAELTLGVTLYNFSIIIDQVAYDFENQFTKYLIS